MRFSPTRNHTFILLLVFTTFLYSFTKDNSDLKKLNEIPCKYSVEYSNSDSNTHATLYIEYYSPTINGTVKDTINNKSYWESPSIAYNSNDSIYLKIITKTPSFNHVIQTTVVPKFVLVDEKNTTLSYFEYKSNSSRNVIISGKRTILTDIKILTGRVKFSEK